MVRPGIRAYFRLRPRSRAHIASHVDEEIALHIELRAQELMRRGLPELEARAEAERRFGGERSRAALRRRAAQRERRMSLSQWLEGWREDFAFSARALMREPLLALVIVATLALGLGANATMFSIVDQLLLRGPAHVMAAEQVRRVYVTESSPSNWNRTTAYTGYVTYTMLRERPDLFAGVAAYRTAAGRIGRGAEAREFRLGWSTPDMFPLLGVEPVIGRFFTAEEDRPKQAQRVALLDFGYWQTEYGGAQDVPGRTLIVGDEEYTIIGVMPEGFTGPERAPVTLWLPFSTGFEPHPDWPTTWDATWLNVVVRLRDDVPLDRVNAEVTGLYRAAAPERRTSARQAQLAALPLDAGGNGEEPPELAVTRWLAGVSIIVLLVACANVINLLLARSVRRRREVAVRLALGVSRARLMRLLLSESLLLAVLGGVLALAIVVWGGQFLRATLMPDVQWTSPLTLRLLGFSSAAILVTGLLVGFAPALQAQNAELTSALKDTSRQAGTARGRLRAGLAVLQAAFSLVLLIGAGLFVRSLWNIRSLDLGLDADRVLAVWPIFPSVDDLPEKQQQAERDRRRVWLTDVLADLRADPAIQSASLAIGAPLQGSMGVPLSVPGRDSLPALPGGGPYIVPASPDYFATVGTTIVRGRDFQPHEGKASAPVAIVSETMARTLWPDEDPLTKCIIVGAADSPCAPIVGVAEDVRRRSLREEPYMQYYVPLGQEAGIAGTQILVRPRANAARYVDDLRRRLHTAAPSAHYFDISPLQETLDPQIRPWRLGATMFLVFGCLALLIAAIGLYSLIAYMVAQRRTEIGVRLALGARATNVVRMVMRQAMAHALLGIALGVSVCVVAGRFIQPMLFDTSARDTTTFVVVTLALLLVALAASALPAARAGRTSPVDALRAD